MPDEVRRATPIRWEPNRQVTAAVWPVPPLSTAMWRGLRARCPVCGKGNLFAGWLRIISVCPTCATPLGAIRADDAPPYFTIFIVGHLVVAGLIAVESLVTLSVLALSAIFLPLTLGLCVALLRPVKGATVGLMLRLGLVSPPDATDPPARNA